MRTVSKVCTIIAIVLLSVALLFQSMALYAITHRDVVTELAENQWLTPAWITSLVLLPVSLVLTMLLKKKERMNLLPLLMAAVGTVLALMVAIALRNALPTQVNMNSINQTQGLTVWRLVYRHLTSVAAGVFIMIACHLNGKATRDERIQAENDAYKEHFDLSETGAVFKDEESTIGLNRYAEEFGEKAPTRRLKRSLRDKLRKK